MQHARHANMVAIIASAHAVPSSASVVICQPENNEIVTVSANSAL